MNVTIRKEGLTVNIEGETIPQETINAVVEAVYGKPKTIVNIGGEVVINGQTLRMRTFDKGGVLEKSVNAIV